MDMENARVVKLMIGLHKMGGTLASLGDDLEAIEEGLEELEEEPPPAVSVPSYVSQSNRPVSSAAKAGPVAKQAAILRPPKS